MRRDVFMSFIDKLAKNAAIIGEKNRELWAGVAERGRIAKEAFKPSA